MSILIKMEMPKGCNDCNFQCFAKWGGDSSYANEIATKCLATDKFVFPSDSERDENCPLIELPPHGRLIEKNDVFELIRSFPNVDRHLPVEFMKALYELPTIIEAEEGE